MNRKQNAQHIDTECENNATLYKPVLITAVTDSSTQHRSCLLNTHIIRP